MASENYDKKLAWQMLHENVYRQKGDFLFLKEPENKKYIPSEDNESHICTVIQSPENERKFSCLLYRPYFKKNYFDSKRHLELIEIMRAAEHLGMAGYNKYLEKESVDRRYLIIDMYGKIKARVNRTRGGLITIEMTKKRNLDRLGQSYFAVVEYSFKNHKNEKVAEGIYKAISFIHEEKNKKERG